jgi:hypothetical protein
MKPDKAPRSKKLDERTTSKAWEPMTVTYVGDAREVVQGGGGKLSQTAGDTGDTRKPSGQG